MFRRTLPDHRLVGTPAVDVSAAGNVETTAHLDAVTTAYRDLRFAIGRDAIVISSRDITIAANRELYLGTAGKGPVLASGSGARWRLNITDAGTVEVIPGP